MAIQRLTKVLPVCLGLLASACGGGTSSNESTATTTGGEAAAVADDRMPPAATALAEVEAPADLLATVRVGALDPTYTALMTLMRQGGPSTIQQDLEDATGSATLAALVDRAKGAEFAVVMAANRPEVVSAFDGPSMRDALRGIPRTIQTEAMPDGALMVHDDTDESSRRECSIEPTSVPTRTRIVCARDLATLEMARLYLSRNFPTPIEPSRVEGILAVRSIRIRYGDDARSALLVVGTMTNTLLARAAEEGDLPAPARMLLADIGVRAKLEVIVRDLVDDASSFIGDLMTASITARIGDDGVHADIDIEAPVAHGSIVRAFSASLRNTGAVPDELVARLPPGGTVYITGDWNSEPLADLATEIRELVTAIAASDSRLSAADRDALERAMAIAYRPQAYVYAMASGMDPAAQPWTVTSIRFATEADARGVADAVRALVGVLRRPSVARAFDRYFESLGDDRPRFAQIAEVRTTGVPQGSYSARFPPLERLYMRLITDSLDLPMPETAIPTNRTILLVPSGRDLLAIQATDAAAVYRGLASAGGLSSEMRSAMTSGGWAATMAIRLGNFRLPGPGANQETGARTLESIIGTEAGQAISIVRVRDSGTGNEAHLEISLDVPGAVLRGVAEAD